MDTHQQSMGGSRIGRKQCVRCQVFFYGGNTARYCLDCKGTREQELRQRGEERRRARRNL